MDGYPPNTPYGRGRFGNGPYPNYFAPNPFRRRLYFPQADLYDAESQIDRIRPALEEMVERMARIQQYLRLARRIRDPEALRRARGLIRQLRDLADDIYDIARDGDGDEDEDDEDDWTDFEG